MSLALLHEAFRSEPRHTSPFLVLGDPTPEISIELCELAAKQGATQLELGIAYDDPCADGPAIQAADRRARRAGMTTGRAFELMQELRRRLPTVPFNMLVYGNLVHARGYATFCEQAAAAGASSLLVPDIPHDEAPPLHKACRGAGIGIVQLVAPLTRAERLAAIDAECDAFLYLAAQQAVTGKNIERTETRSELVRRITDAVDNPVCVGFGLSNASQVRDVFACGGKLAVIGSHLARAIEAAWANPTRDPATVKTSFLEAWRQVASNEQSSIPET